MSTQNFSSATVTLLYNGKSIAPSTQHYVPHVEQWVKVAALAIVGALSVWCWKIGGHAKGAAMRM